MSWQLEIHIIDVGQGESSFIVARDTRADGEVRTMLIDGGEQGAAPTVHDYVASQGYPVTHIVASHYDKDHSLGIEALMIADNMWAICDALGAAVSAAPTRGTRAQVVAGYACAVYAAGIGASGDEPGGSTKAIEAARGEVGRNASDAEAIQVGVDVSRQRNDAHTITTFPTEAMCIEAVNEVVPPAVGKRDPRTAARKSALTWLQPRAMPGAQFSTGGLYRGSHVIDIGDTGNIKPRYKGAVAGTCYLANNTRLQVPGLRRNRTSAPTLGSEVLWGTGPKPKNPDPNAPAAFVASCRAYVWGAPARSVPIASGQRDNDVCLGLIVRFNNFFYWTGGDLPYQGEDLVAASIRKKGLPVPGSTNTFPPAKRIALFKCGHHGSGGSTSDTFLKLARAGAALISCGFNTQFEHPDDDTINRLDNDYYVDHFYLTNCNFLSDAVPASKGKNQLRAPGNKSRVAGDNRRPNNRPNRHRGDIRVTVTQGQSDGTSTPEMTATYWDEDAGGIRRERTNFDDP